MDAKLAESPYNRLIFELLDAQDTFERLLAVSHIDDKLVNKQVSIYDDEDVTRGRYMPELWAQRRKEYEPSILAMLHDISFINRQRRDWRLLKDWNPAHRPW